VVGCNSVIDNTGLSSFV